MARPSPSVVLGTLATLWALRATDASAQRSRCPQSVSGDALVTPTASLAPSPVPRIEALPAVAWTHVVQWDLPGPVVSAVVATTEGYAVGVTGPPAVVFLDARGVVRSTARMDRSLVRDPAPVADGAVLATDDAGGVVLVAPDGTTRGGGRRAGQGIVASPLVRTDGSSVVVSVSPGTSSIAVISPAGDPLWARTLPGAVLVAPVLLPHDVVAFSLVSGHLGLLSASGELTRVPFLQGVVSLAAMDGDGLAAVVGSEVVLATGRGGVRARADLGSTLAWVAPLPENRVAVLRTGTPAELVVLESDLSVRFRAACPPDAAPPLVDPSGSLLVVGRAGEVVALTSTGASLWQMHMHQGLRPPAIALPGGGVVIATTGHALVALH